MLSGRGTRRAHAWTADLSAVPLAGACPPRTPARDLTTTARLRDPLLDVQEATLVAGPYNCAYIMVLSYSAVVPRADSGSR